jgi:hypothetical protein
VGDNADKIFATLSVDGAGQVHVVLPVRHNDDPVSVASNQPEQPSPTDLILVTSPDQGAHWTPPLKINQKTGSYFFPWIAAGDAGRFDAVYYRTSSLKPNDPTDLWYIGFSQVTYAVATLSNGQAVYTKPPRVRELLIERTPVHKGGICTFGIFCSATGGNRSLADSIAVAIDPSGAANASWTNDYDVATGTSGSKFRRIEFGCQSGGPSVFIAASISGCYRGSL